jgi:glycerol kinase
MLVKELKVDGPLAKSDSLIQFTADVLQVPLVRMKHPCGLALGAAMALSQDTKKVKIERAFQPNMDPISSLAKFNEWRRQRDYVYRN